MDHTNKAIQGSTLCSIPARFNKAMYTGWNFAHACEICGAPWERVVEREPMEKRDQAGAWH